LGQSAVGVFSFATTQQVIILIAIHIIITIIV